MKAPCVQPVFAACHALCALRSYILPHIFKAEHLEALDPLEKDEGHTPPDELPSRVRGCRGT